MKVIAKRISEQKVKEPVRKSTEPAKIHAAMVAKAQCCVDHLCGCKK